MAITGGTNYQQETAGVHLLPVEFCAFLANPQSGKGHLYRSGIRAFGESLASSSHKGAEVSEYRGTAYADQTLPPHASAFRRV